VGRRTHRYSRRSRSAFELIPPAGLCPISRTNRHRHSGFLYQRNEDLSGVGRPHVAKRDNLGSSLYGARGCNFSQIALQPKPQEQAKTVAVGCDWLPREVHGKEEGVSGSSPEEGLQNCRKSCGFRPSRLAELAACGEYGAVYGAPRFENAAEHQMGRRRNR
jgi:hypothetical protein